MAAASSPSPLESNMLPYEASQIFKALSSMTLNTG
jgi:hypothetical protein